MQHSTFLSDNHKNGQDSTEIHVSMCLVSSVTTVRIALKSAWMNNAPASLVQKRYYYLRAPLAWERVHMGYSTFLYANHKNRQMSSQMGLFKFLASSIRSVRIALGL